MGGCSHLQSLASLVACVSRERGAARSNGVPLLATVSLRLFASFRCVSLARCVGLFALHSLASLAAGVSLEKGATFFIFVVFNYFSIVSPRPCASFRNVSLESGDVCSLCTRWPLWPLAFRYRGVPFFSIVSTGQSSASLYNCVVFFDLHSLASLAAGVLPERGCHFFLAFRLACSQSFDAYRSRYVRLF